MKYITSEKILDSIITIQKARGDIEQIAEKLGYQRVEVPTTFSIRYKKWQKPVQAYLYQKNAHIWNKTFKQLEDGSEVLLQVNFHNKCPNFYKIMQKHCHRLNFTVIIHDLESILFADDSTKSQTYKVRTLKNELNTLKYAEKIISHNANMTKKLVELGIEQSKITNLEIFDYLASKNNKSNIHFGKEVIIAGNLGPEKSPYLENIKAVKGVNFKLYGFNLNQNSLSDNVKYCGNFAPEELIDNLSGSFGLIWDGTSIDTCAGHTGNYLRYNNPHKTSLYLSAGLPVIIWQEAALAEFIQKNNVGLVVKSLAEIPEKLAKLKKVDYELMQKNATALSKKLRSGYFTTAALETPARG